MPAIKRILVVGAGAWGTALAIALTRNGGNEVYLWGRDAEAMRRVARTREHARYLPGVRLPPSLAVMSGEQFPPRCDLLVMAVPFQTLRAALLAIPGPPARIVCACKGLENESNLRADEIVATVMPAGTEFAMISGPNFAIEVARDLPAAITVGAVDPAYGRALVKCFHSPTFRPYWTDDVIGVQIGGAVKNVMAIAAGISDGLQLGSNSRAALITRGLAEITRFGVAQGGRVETFMGLSGLGDLILTCTDDKSRNRRFGLSLGAGNDVERATRDAGLVEGAATARALMGLARRSNIAMPISEQVVAAIDGTTSPREAVRRLLAREPVAEREGLRDDGFP